MTKYYVCHSNHPHSVSVLANICLLCSSFLISAVPGMQQQLKVVFLFWLQAADASREAILVTGGDTGGAESQQVILTHTQTKSQYKPNIQLTDPVVIFR